MLCAKMSGYQIHNLQAVTQFLIYNFCSFRDREVAAGGQVETFHTLAIPIEVWGVQQVTWQVDQVS